MLKYRPPDGTPDGEQTTKVLGPAWTERGRTPAGYYTERTAEQAKEAFLADARRGTLAGARKTGATFSDAAAEYLRYVEDVRQIDPATVADYRGVIDAYLLEEFGELPLGQVTADRIDAYKEKADR